jgi:hypothetical protein
MTTAYKDLDVELQRQCDAMKMHIAELAVQHAEKKHPNWYLRFQFNHPDVARICAEWSFTELEMQSNVSADRQTGTFIVTFFAKDVQNVAEKARAFSAKVNT